MSWRPRRTDGLVLLAFLVCGVILFRLSLFEGWTFVGDSDRLNTFLNVRLFEVRSIQERGTVPLWSEQQFMGASMAGLNWMLPGVSPFPYLVALFPISEAFRVSNLITMGLFVLAAWTAYLALKAYSAGPLPAALGGLVYATSAYAVHRLAQVDASFSVLIVMPLLLLSIRQTHRTTAIRTFPVIVACWASLTLFTFLQEVAYVTILCGAYALYRSARLRDQWPVAVAGLGFGLGVLIGLPRLVTVGFDVMEIDRASSLRENLTIEALRYFGDGLLGRSSLEHRLYVRGTLNMHEGVQLLGSGLASLAVLAAALLSRSSTMRALGVTLLLVISVALTSFSGDVDVPGLGEYTYPSVALRALVLHALIVGAAIWGVSWWIGRRRAVVQHSNPASTARDETPDATLDGPFMLGVTILVLAAVLIPEARLVLYNAFARADFSHSRFSIATLLPQAALVTIFAHRLLAAGQPRDTSWRWVRRVGVSWLSAGLVLGVLLWLARELAVGVIVSSVGQALETPPWRLLTSEAVRLGGAVLVILVLAVAFLRRVPAAWLTLAGGVLIAWTASEALFSADYRLSGPHTRRDAMPFDTFSYLNAPPGTLRPPTAEERAAVQARLETDSYRTVLVHDAFPAIVEPDLAMFWGLRLIEGYPNLPRRLARLPWAPGMTSLRQLDIGGGIPSEQMPWRLLAALNVKYVLHVDRSFWFNPAPGGSDPPVDPSRFRLMVNPHPVMPRAFFTAMVAPIGRVPRLSGDRGDRPAPRDPPITPPEQRSVVEGVSKEQRYATDGALSPTFDQDRVLVQVEPSDRDRFLVVNEMYHPAWRAWVDGMPTEVYPTNLVMRGVVVPAGTTTVELRYVPFIVSPPGFALFGAALVVTLVCWWVLGRYACARHPSATPAVVPA